jgi:hypothetical protein
VSDDPTRSSALPTASALPSWRTHSVPVFRPKYSGAVRLNLSQAIQNLFNDIRDAAQTISPVVAIIGFIGLGIMYLGSSWPIVGDWKGRP